MANEKQSQLEGGTYEIIRDRLSKQGRELQQRIARLNESRKEVFGSTEAGLVATERITTENNCYARDIAPLGNNRFLFGYNVHMGLKTETHISDVFSVYSYDGEKHEFHAAENFLYEDEQFKLDFANLYKYYRDTRFAKFAAIGQHVFMVFQVGKTPEDIKVFKFTPIDGGLKYIDNRSDHEYRYPDQHEFRWVKATRDMHRKGMHPHISIEDRLFVETTGGDLTIKVEDNTDTGHGIYSEKVDDPDQTLDDADIHYAIIGNLIALKIKPYQEQKYRYIVYNEKIREAVRIDALEDSCVLLPDDHGIIFARGYYIQTGEVKLFDNQLNNMLFEKRLTSPNGEDFLYVFYQKGSGTYTLLPYNIIKQEVATPIICNGYSFFEDGELILFKAEDEQKKHHALQIWQTPFYSPNKTVKVENNSYLFKIGNKDVVRAMSEGSELIKLINKEDSYANLYTDLVKTATDILDSYHWLDHAEAEKLSEPLREIRETASTAIEEYEKVLRIKKNTRSQTQEVTEKADSLISRVKHSRAKSIDEFVERLALLRASKGEIIALKDLRYADTGAVEKYEQQLTEVTDTLSKETVQFLLKKEALQPYEERVGKLDQGLEKISKTVEAHEMEESILKVSKDLEMLIEIVSNLKIEDATHTTSIIDKISAIYSQFNRINAALKKKRKQLLGKEGEAEFNSQVRLINQGMTNYLDICDTPEKCEEYLNKLMVQLEELEGRFAEFDQFLERISEKREEVYNAFESKKLYLTEARNKKSLALQQSAERIITSIRKRMGNFKTAEEINAYYASDLMVDKVRDLSKQLLSLGDSVKADDVQSKLKTAYEESLRQLKDKQELFVDGEDVIRLGRHSFNVNTQNVELSLVERDGDMYLHITGTAFFERVQSPALLATREVWTQSLPSENHQVYRAEYLAYQLFGESLAQASAEVKTAHYLNLLAEKELLEYVQERMSTRYDEGYVKGVHDKDATHILNQLLSLYHGIGLLRYSPASRVLAYLWWHHLVSAEAKNHWEEQFRGIRSILKVFPNSRSFSGTMNELRSAIDDATSALQWKDEKTLSDAAEFLFHLLAEEVQLSFSAEAWELADHFQTHLRKQRSVKEFETSWKNLNDPLRQYAVVQNWLKSYTTHAGEAKTSWAEDVPEAAVILMEKQQIGPEAHQILLHGTIENLNGDHPAIVDGKYELHYNRFMDKLHRFETHNQQQFRAFAKAKHELLQDAKTDLRLNEFKPRVMSSFVRNRLIDEVYLPLIGDNLAKQMGAAGDNKRTDLMGMLLLISPPGYGKTTLMEYVCDRLGLVFMKVNGPSIGHEVTNIDPASAGNSAAREELEKLNLAFEMGDNVMIYVDDIQHCNPEFLQKFISLCDSQRKIEGVYKGQSKTYDLRGKKVAVVMAGNPYTESGEKFQIPDMLANRADIYNLGDIIGGKQDAFELSYLENSLTSNSSTARLNGRSRKDVHTLIRIAATGERESVELEANHSPEEVNEYVKMLEKMIRVRNIILKVNKHYILSAGQAEEFRSEPPFRLQGSYRNMSKIVEKLSPVMNESEMETLILSHYENESQTLTSGAEYNFLKFRELFEVLTPEEKLRKAEIVESFKRNQRLKGLGGNEIGHVIEQMQMISSGLGDLVRVFQAPVVPEQGAVERVVKKN